MTNKEKEFYLLLLGWRPSKYYREAWVHPNTRKIFNLSSAHLDSIGLSITPTQLSKEYLELEKYDDIELSRAGKDSDQ